MHAEPAQPEATAGEEDHDQRGENHAKVKGLDQPAVALVVATGAIVLGNQGVEAQQEADAEDGHGEVEGASQADGTDGLGAEAADEEGVDDAHGHPAQLGQDDGAGQREHGLQLGSHSLPEPPHGISLILRLGDRITAGAGWRRAPGLPESACGSTGWSPRSGWETREREFRFNPPE